MRFDFIECFTTTFLRTHSWLNWVDEDDDDDDFPIYNTGVEGRGEDMPTGLLDDIAKDGEADRLQLGLRFWFPPDPEVLFNVFEPKLVDRRATVRSAAQC